MSLLNVVLSHRSVFIALPPHPNMYRKKSFNRVVVLLGEVPMKTPAKDPELSYEVDHRVYKVLQTFKGIPCPEYHNHSENRLQAHA